MISVLDVKSYLRIPHDEDDEFLETLILIGYGYLADAIDDYDTLYTLDANFAQKADLWVMTQWCPELYDNREGMTSARPSLSFLAIAMLTQLQLYKGNEEVNTSDKCKHHRRN